MLAVGVATILTCLIRKQNLSTLGWGWGSWKYQWMSYLLPLGIAFVAYLIIWIAGFGAWYNSEFVIQQTQDYNLNGWSETSVIIFHLALTATYSFVMLLPSVLGEELGWRGFLVPELAKFMSFSGVAITSGLIWSIWHWPLILMGLYGNEGTPLAYQLFFFSLYIVSSSVIMTYLRFKTNSLWTAVIFHMSGNVFLQKAFTPLTIENDQSAWYVNEFGAVPAVVAFLTAIYFWKKGKAEFSDLASWRNSAIGTRS
jgi:membrane protease YdiL (CAAX protease family)